MQADLVVRMLGDLFWTGMLVCAPVLAFTIAIGLVVSVLQVVTQVQEASLSFVPKLVVAALTIIAFGPWMLRTLVAYTARLWSGIPSMF